MTAPVVLVSPAMAVPSRFYRPLVQAFEDRGWDAVALPRRGFEPEQPSASRHVDWGYADELADLADAVATARADRPERPVLVLGHSLGAQLAVGNQVGGEPADGLVLVGASVPHHRHYPWFGAGILLYASVLPMVTRVLGHLPPPAFGGPGAATLMREWAGFARTGRPPFPVPARVADPALVVHLQGDGYAVSSANKRFVEQLLEPESTTRWVYTKGAAPEGGTTDHVRWVRTPEVVVDRVVTWWHAQAPTTGP